MEIILYKVIIRASGTKSLMVRNKKVEDWTEALIGHPSEDGDYEDFEDRLTLLLAGYEDRGYQIVEVPNI
ncbi:hypothetical protein EH164_10980 [Kosakonia sp. CCTCC M2018092]|uniref:hypothetical protein n=1 Tax=Kosakonia sp. CCTCC M2018092 TaxID=2492396 RepID=UPI000F605A99|nr:hypothetical protein [Kosakonia sp. CCTCC M2018092]AZI87547.1 hypothetical protein EH164_10980 [Kosakonia sp. CCTCC M2018092]